jgi:two-component system NtrC family sensor kinase
MKTLLHKLKDLFDGPFQATLIFSFTLVAALTIGIGTFVISRTISTYLAGAMDERVQQDIQCAELFYKTRQEGLSLTASQLSLSATVIQKFGEAALGEGSAIADLNNKLLTALTDDTLKGNRVAAILDDKGVVISGVIIKNDLSKKIMLAGGDWSRFSPAAEVLETGSSLSSTEVIPLEVLRDAEMLEQARINLLDTPKAGQELFDDREGSAGLGIASISPIFQDGDLVGAVVVFHLFNNDFTLVDSIKNSTQVDTVTIFFGDLRVSTNVMTEEGKRAVGTRVSDEVSQVVLQEGSEYVGNAFVVNENYITRYDPLFDHQGNIVGILYVGTRQQAFLDFLNTFYRSISLVALVTIVMTFLLATPVSRVITRPLKELHILANTSQLVAAGDLSARAPTAAGGEVGLLAASLNDMLDTLQATQEQLLQSEKLASLGQLAAGVAHELNNPLATVLLFADVLARENAGKGQHQSDIETIIRETKRCKTIVASLLDFARQQKTEITRVDLNRIIQQVVFQERKLPRYGHVKIRTSLDPSLPLIMADQTQLETLLTNLMMNAADAMPDGGELSIHTRYDGAEQVELEVEDDGIGISAEDQGKLFTPFFTTKSPGKGTGLGLSIVYGIIQMHGGKIMVESEPGQGARFIVSLPKTINKAQTLGARPAAPDGQTLIGNEG